MGQGRSAYAVPACLGRHVEAPKLRQSVPQEVQAVCQHGHAAGRAICSLMATHHNQQPNRASSHPPAPKQDRVWHCCTITAAVGLGRGPAPTGTCSTGLHEGCGAPTHPSTARSGPATSPAPWRAAGRLREARRVRCMSVIAYLAFRPPREGPGQRAHARLCRALWLGVSQVGAQRTVASTAVHQPPASGAMIPGAALRGRGVQDEDGSCAICSRPAPERTQNPCQASLPSLFTRCWNQLTHSQPWRPPPC